MFQIDDPSTELFQGLQISCPFIIRMMSAYVDWPHFIILKASGRAGLGPVVICACTVFSVPSFLGLSAFLRIPLFTTVVQSGPFFWLFIGFALGGTSFCFCSVAHLP